MDIDQLIELEIKTRDLVAALEQEIQDAEKHKAPPGKLDGTEGRLSRQDTLMNHEFAKEAQRRRQVRLQLLKDALERMDLGTFGQCANCSAAIENDRLELQPETLVCANCAKR